MTTPQPRETPDADAQDATPTAAPSWAQLKTQHTNARKSVRLTLRGDLMDEIATLEEAMHRQEREDEKYNREDLAPKIARQIQDLVDQARAAEVLFTFQGLGAGEFAKLRANHPATPENLAELGTEELEWNPDTFPPALMAASCIAPADLHGNLAEWAEIHRSWSNGQVMRLWTTCMAANAMGADTPKSERASEVLRRLSSASNSSTAPR